MTRAGLLHCGIFFPRINHCTSQPVLLRSKHQIRNFFIEAENHLFCGGEAERKFSSSEIDPLIKMSLGRRDVLRVLCTPSYIRDNPLFGENSRE